MVCSLLAVAFYRALNDTWLQRFWAVPSMPTSLSHTRWWTCTASAWSCGRWSGGVRTTVRDHMSHDQYTRSTLHELDYFRAVLHFVWHSHQCVGVGTSEDLALMQFNKINVWLFVFMSMGHHCCRGRYFSHLSSQSSVADEACMVVAEMRPVCWVTA